MPPLRPFRGLRYDPAGVDLAEVTAPPYDVIDAAHRQRLADRHPANAVCVDLPGTHDGAYADARKLLDEWMAEGVLRRDPPSLYVYRMSRAAPDGSTRHTTGVFGALELSRPDEGAILPHEFTTPKAKSDRLSLMRATRANLSAVWALSPAPGLTDLLVTDTDPAASWQIDGITHALWPVTDPDRIAAIGAAVGAHPVVIADGHHRYETSLTYRDEQRDASASASAGAGSLLAYVVELVDDELEVLPIHRLVSGLPDDYDLLGALAGHFTATDAGAVTADMADRLVRAGALGLVTPAGVWFLEPRPDREPDGRDLDSSRLDTALEALPVGELRFQHGIDEVVAAVADGEAQAGFLLRPATVGQIVDIAHGGERMPPKTTFFSPKPCTGVVLPPARRVGRAVRDDGARRPVRSVDRPGGARVQQVGEIAGTVAVLGHRQLAAHLGAVVGPVDRPEHADRRGLVRSAGQT